MKHIHFISLLSRSPWGGCEELWSKAALWLAGHSNEVSVSIRWWPQDKLHPRVAQLEKLGAKVTFWGGKRGSIRSWLVEGANRVIGKLPFGSPIPPVDFGVKPADLVVFSSGGNEFPIEPIRKCRDQGIRYVLVIHSVSESNWPRDGALKNLRWIYEGAEAACFVSHANLESTTYQLGMRSEKFKVVVNPFNVPWETPFSWPAESGRHEWAFVGRLEPGHKGVDLLLRAFARDRWQARPVHINFYGDGFSEESTKRMATMLGLDSKVTFHGQVSGLAGIWERNELLVLPSRHEGLPLVVTEAMLYGRPCLVTDVSGNPEQLEEGVTGFVADGPTTNAVDKALERAWQARDKLPDMGRAAYDAIRGRIPMDPIAVFSEELLALAACGKRMDRPTE